MNEEDPLGDMLRHEIPKPAHDYWETIDAGLANNVDPQNLNTEHDDVRRMGMTRSTPSSPGRWFLAAAALLLPVVVGAWFFSQSDELILTQSAAQDQQLVETRGDSSGSNSDVETPDDPSTQVLPGPESSTTDLVAPGSANPKETEPPTDGPDVEEGAEEIEVEPPRPGFSPAASIVGPSCYQGSDISEGLAVRLTINANGAATGVRSVDVNGTVFVEDAVGYLVADDTAAMLVTPAEPDRDRYTALWYFSDQSISLAEDVAASAVDCQAVAAQISQAETTIEAKPAVAQPANPAALAAGTHCFINDEGHPGPDYVRITVDEDAGLTAETRSFSDRRASREERAITPSDGVVEVASGVFSTDVDILLRVVSMSGDQTNERFEYWKVLDDGDTLQMSQFQFKSRRAPCAVIAGFFADR